MKIVVINGTEQRGSTYAMKEMFMDAAARVGLAQNNTRAQNETSADAAGRGDVVEYYLPADCPAFCTGCKACFYNDISVCPHAQYTVPIWEAISAADLLVFTSPVYVYHVTAQMKALLDHYATKWMAHSPERQMFAKQAVIITNSAGAGMSNVAKDIGDSLRFWGVARIHVVKQGLFESRWEHVSDKRKARVKRRCETVCRRIKPVVKTSLGAKGRFYSMQTVHKMIHKDMLKRGQPETRDHIYWRENGWLSGGTPWGK